MLYPRMAEAGRTVPSTSRIVSVVFDDSGTDSYDVTNESVVRVDAALGAGSIALPDARDRAGEIITISDVSGSGTSLITVTGTDREGAARTLDTMNAQHEHMAVYSDGDYWYVVCNVGL